MKVYFTLADKAEYPLVIEIMELIDSGTIAKCECFCPTGITIEQYSISELRLYSVKEYYDDVVEFFNLERLNYEDLFSKDFLVHLQEFINNYEAKEKEIIHLAKSEGIDVTDLNSSTLADYDRYNDILDALFVLQEMCIGE